MTTHCDVVVIGGGMAGVSVAFELCGEADVVLLEAEASLAHHTTGRSAALYAPGYGNDLVRRITAASLPDFDRIGAALADSPLLAPRELLCVAAPEDLADLDAYVAAQAPGAPVVPITDAEALGRFPALRPERLGGAALEHGSSDIDVAALHQAYVRGLSHSGAAVRRSERVVSITQAPAGATSAGRWHVATSSGDAYETGAVVDAAGAWADEVARMAGIAPVGLTPCRRTLFTSPVNEGGWPLPVDSWAFLLEVNERFYCRPEGGGRLLVSPADETPSEPCDAVPDPLDIARAIERLNEHTTLGLRSVASAWAGLRTFAPDRSPVVGEGGEGFVWCAGQGGYGIQMAPALARITAAAVLGRPSPVGGVALAELSPDRFKRA